MERGRGLFADVDASMNANASVYAGTADVEVVNGAAAAGGSDRLARELPLRAAYA